MKTYKEFIKEIKLNEDSINVQTSELKGFLDRLKPIFKSKRFFYSSAIFTNVKIVDNTLTFQMKTMANVHGEPYVTGYDAHRQIPEDELLKASMEKAGPMRGVWYVWVQKDLASRKNLKVAGGGIFSFTVSQDLHPKQDPREMKLGTPMFTIGN